ncbi:transporter [Sphingomonas cavernae]|uniref:Transporter n=1 Tax=Sphingomonas cavernae TaxID=2320861 RepID=A0A418WRY8_9SPHN|nr:transporter [Sphingomonas cavernae]RJF94014.1 transporter [Sphingomonas cavernae]
MHGRISITLCLLAAGGMIAGRASAQQAPAGAELVAMDTAPTASDGVLRQSLDDAWWTGPIIANSPVTLPPGHGYIESYLFDVKTKERDSFNSLTFMQYGVAEGLTLGIIPTAGFNRVDNALDSSGVGIGDTTLMATWRLSKYEPGNWVPTTALSIQQSLPTGKYDRLGSRPADGLGSGAYTTTIGFFGQAWFWMPNGRILRGRINLQRSFSSDARVEDVSVYGTPEGFRGRAKPGASFFFVNSWEYSLSRSWVLAVDLGYRHDNRTRVAGTDGAEPVRFATKPADTFIVAPAVEYSWTAKHGVIFGVRYIPANGPVPESVTPVVALSIFM